MSSSEASSWMFCESATELADPPHRFDGARVSEECGICLAPVLDARHVAWERAALARTHPDRF